MPTNKTPKPPADEEATAYHEAGHAVVGAIRGRAPLFVTIIRSGRFAGRTEFPQDWQQKFMTYFDDSPEKHEYIETRILTDVAGTLAHDTRFPARVHDAGDAHDEHCARELIANHAGWAGWADSERDEYLKQLRETARGLLETHWPWVEAVACALIDRKTISGPEVMKLRP